MLRALLCHRERVFIYIFFLFGVGGGEGEGEGGGGEGVRGEGGAQMQPNVEKTTMHSKLALSCQSTQSTSMIGAGLDAPVWNPNPQNCSKESHQSY